MAKNTLALSIIAATLSLAQPVSGQSTGASPEVLCTAGQFYSAVSRSCQSCHSSCDSWCMGPLSSDCLVCPDGTSFRDLQTWQCVAQCPTAAETASGAPVFPLTLPNKRLQAGQFKYCRALSYYVDPSSAFSNLELGTRQYPFKAIDDPFRELMNIAAQLDGVKVRIYLKHGSNLTMHSIDMPLVTANAQIFIDRFSPYTDSPGVDLTQNLVSINVYHSQYYRPRSNFNPTLETDSVADLLAMPYNFPKLVKAGVLPASALSSIKYKFALYNTDLTVSYIRFTEVTFADATANAIFFPYFAQYKWIRAFGCAFELRQQLVMTQEGANINITNSLINISKINRVTIYQSMSQCALYQKPFSANNQIWNNNTFTGINSGGYTALIYTQNHCNFTLTNNKFIDSRWINSGISINMEHVAIPCPVEQYTRILIENNTVRNSGPTPSLSYIYFTMNFNDNGVQEAIIRNNRFENVQYSAPGFFRILKTKPQNLKIAFENNVFARVANTLEAFPIATLSAPAVSIANISAQDSIIPQMISLTAGQATVRNINLSRVQGLSSSSLNNAFLQIQTSKNVVIDSLTMQGCQFETSRAINILSSSGLTISRISINDSEANQNNLFYLSKAQDVSISSVDLRGIRKTVSGQTAVLYIELMPPWASPSLPMIYNFTDWNYASSQVQFLEFSSILLNGDQGMSSSNGPLKILFNRLQATNITLRDKTNFAHLNQLVYDRLDIQFDQCTMANSSVDLGRFFHLQHSSPRFALTNAAVENNTGQVMLMEPPLIQNVNFTLGVVIANATFKRNSAGMAILFVSEKSNMTISNSTFMDNYSTGRGSVVFSEKLNSRCSITNTTFRNNYALMGGVFFTQLNGFVSCVGCTLGNNFAMYGGVLFSQNEGQAEFFRSTFQANNALKASLVYSINSQSQIKVRGGLITQNGNLTTQSAIDVSQIYGFADQATSYSVLGKMYAYAYIKTLEANLAEVRKLIGFGSAIKYPQIMNYQFQLIKSTLTLGEGLRLSEQTALLSSQSASIVTIDGLEYFNTSSKEGSLIVSDQATLQFRNSYFGNITSQKLPIFLLQADSQGSFSNLTIMRSNGPILSSDSSQITLTDAVLASIVDIGTAHSLIEIRQSQASLVRLSLNEVHSGMSSPRPYMAVKDHSSLILDSFKGQNFDSLLIQVEDKSMLTLNNSVIQDASNLQREQQQMGLAISLQTSSAIVINSTFSNLISLQGPGIYAMDYPQASTKQSLSLQDCTFTMNLASSLGGAVVIENIDGEVKNSTFSQNRAKALHGGALMLSCAMENKKKCLFEVQGNTFANNTAQVNGGAIYYDLFSPVGLLNNSFSNNSAQYGPNYASYPFRLKQVALLNSSDSSTTSNSSKNTTAPTLSLQAHSDAAVIQLVSGRVYERDIAVGIFDQNDQLVSTDNDSEGILSSADILVQISGNNKILSRNGIYTFSALKFVGQPDYNSSIRYLSNALDQSKISLINGVNQTKDFQEPVYFRACVTGEVVQNKMCVGCVRGYYSFNSSSVSCTKCFAHGVCNGTNQTEVDPGYWRSTLTSAKPIQCTLPESCLGGKESECAEGYSGRLCNQCVTEPINGDYYARSGAYGCTKCSPLSVQVLTLIGIIVAMFFYIVYLLFSVINNPSRNKPQTVLIRIITNYSQAILIVYQFDLNWPTQVQQALGYFSALSSGQEYVFSFDCLYRLGGMNFNMSNFYVEVIKYGLLPIVASGIGALVWYLIQQYRLWRGQEGLKLRQNIVVTVFVIVYLMYPTISNMSFSLFNCVALDDGNSYLKRDMSVECWTGAHQKVAVPIGLTFILFWVIGFPAFIFYRLWKQREKLNQEDFILRYGLFFVGLNEDAFFWEVIVTNCRKIIFIICSSLMSTSNPIIKAILGIMAMFVQMQLLYSYQPYIDPRFNDIEHYGIYASMLTVFMGLFFIQNEVDQDNNVKFGLFIVVMVVNVYFLSLWLLRFFNILLRSWFSRLQKIRLFRSCLEHREVLGYEDDLRRSLSLVGKQGSFVSTSSFTKQASGGVTYKKQDSKVSIGQESIAYRLSIDGRRKSQLSGLDSGLKGGDESGVSRFREQVRASGLSKGSTNTILDKAVQKGSVGGKAGHTKGGKVNPQVEPLKLDKIMGYTQSKLEEEKRMQMFKEGGGSKKPKLGHDGMQHLSGMSLNAGTHTNKTSHQSIKMECTFNGQSPANSKQGSTNGPRQNQNPKKPKSDFLDPHERNQNRSKDASIRGSSNSHTSNQGGPKVGEVKKDFSNFKSVMDSGQIPRMVTLKKKKTGGSSHIGEGPQLVKNYSNDHYSMEDRDSATEIDFKAQQPQQHDHQKKDSRAQSKKVAGSKAKRDGDDSQEQEHESKWKNLKRQVTRFIPKQHDQ